MSDIKIEFQGNWMLLPSEDRRILSDIADLVDQFNARRQAATAPVTLKPASVSPEQEKP